MPPAAAIAIPAALGVAGLISGNAQQKSAQKNNDNQQSAAVQNSQAAYQQAQAQMQALVAGNPSPFAGQSITGPAATGSQASPIASAIIGQGQPAFRPSNGFPVNARGAVAPPKPPSVASSGVQPVRSPLEPILRAILAGRTM